MEEEKMLMFLQFVIGALLAAAGYAVWYAGRNVAWKARLERNFLMPGDDLFARKRAYSGYVRWLRYVAFPTGLVMLVPTPLMHDVILGLIAAGLFWWMNRQKVAYDQAVTTANKRSTK